MTKSLQEWMKKLNRLYDTGELQNCQFDHESMRRMADDLNVPLISKTKKDVCRELVEAVENYRAAKNLTENKQNLRTDTDEEIEKRSTNMKQIFFDKSNTNSNLRKVTTLTDRLRLTKLIKSGEVQVEQCFYTKNFVQMKWLDLAGSMAFMSKGKWNLSPSLQQKYPNINTDVYMKITYEPQLPCMNNSLATERRLYKYVNTLYKKKYTPHVSLLVTVLKCNEFERHLKQLKKQKHQHALAFAKELDGWYEDMKDNYYMDKILFLVTEDAAGDTLSSTIEKYNNLTKNDPSEQVITFNGFYRPILFQILFTLAVFSEVGLQHNDLHTSNVIITSLSSTSNESYQIDDMCFQFDSLFFARVIDFDLSSKEETAYSDLRLYNTRVMDMLSMGLSRWPNNKADVFRFLHFVHYYNQKSKFPNQYLTEWLERVIPRDLLNNYADIESTAEPGQLIMVGSLCIQDKDPFSDRCNEVDTSKLSTARELLLSGIFQDFRVDCPAETNWTLPSNQ